MNLDVEKAGLILHSEAYPTGVHPAEIRSRSEIPYGTRLLRRAPHPEDDWRQWKQFHDRPPVRPMLYPLGEGSIALRPA